MNMDMSFYTVLEHALGTYMYLYMLKKIKIDMDTDMYSNSSIPQIRVCFQNAFNRENTLD